MQRETEELGRPAQWQAPPRPEWLAALNREGAHLDLTALVPLDAHSLVDTATRRTGLSDFGDEHWRAPFETLCRDLDGPAALTAMGRLMTRSDLLIWLENRLRITALLRAHPEIEHEEIAEPTFIVGLPRSGTSILFEVLSQDPACRAPETWEALFPCPEPGERDARVARAHALVTQWTRVVPEFASMHEMGGRIPAECGLIMANSFRSDHIAALHHAPEYGAFYASADMRPAYRDHRTILKILQWKSPRRRWLLKAPAHQNHLDVLLETYPDARIIQTHRDPIACMASTTSLMGCLLYMRSDLPFDAHAFEDLMQGEAMARRLERVMEQRRAGVVPADRICDSRFQELMDAPLACVERIYRHFGWSLSAAARSGMTRYLADKPRAKLGTHRYAVPERTRAERAWFRRYQELYGVPDEV
jgi:hypothetical protein